MPDLNTAFLLRIELVGELLKSALFDSFSNTRHVLLIEIQIMNSV